MGSVNGFKSDVGQGIGRGQQFDIILRVIKQPGVNIDPVGCFDVIGTLFFDGVVIGWDIVVVNQNGFTLLFPDPLWEA